MSAAFTVRDPATIRDAILRVIRNGLIARGIANPNVSPNSDYYLLAESLANELAVVEANSVIASEATMPDSAVGDDLKRWMAAYGLTFREAAGSIGYVTITSSAPSPIVAGQQLIDDAGLRFEVISAGTYTASTPVQIQAIDVGVNTNHLNGDVLRWISAPPYCAPTVTVGQVGGVDGLTGGIDDETEEGARARLLAHLANPPSSGNWQHVAEIAEASHPSVMKAFVHPALQGPATCHVAVVGYSTAYLQGTISSPSATRQINATTLSSLIAPYVKGLLPDEAEITVTTVQDVAVDVAIGMSLPSAPSASPPGPGGGWVDGTPWPNVSGSRCYVISRTSDSDFVVTSSAGPTVGVSRICWVSATTWKLYTATVTSSVPSGADWHITLDNPFVGIGVGDYVFPLAVNTQAYVTALLKAFAAMGPGEKSSNSAALARGFRHPTPQSSAPYALNATQLRAISDVGEEVLDVAWNYRTQNDPGLPALITDGPKILVPRRIGFYPL